jgi:electron transfer flavoprotein beta subunit
VIEAALPAVVTVSNELGEPRYANIKGVMAAKKKEPVIWKPADIGIGPDELGKSGRRTKLVRLFQPVHEANCEVVTGETAEEAGAKLAQRLHEAKIV